MTHEKLDRRLKLMRMMKRRVTAAALRGKSPMDQCIRCAGMCKRWGGMEPVRQASEMLIVGATGMLKFRHPALPSTLELALEDSFGRRSSLDPPSYVLLEDGTAQVSGLPVGSVLFADYLWKDSQFVTVNL